MTVRLDHFIGGSWSAPAGGEYFASTNPATLEVLYEAALGLGIASGPLLRGQLGDVSWRGPYFGTAVVMASAFYASVVQLGHAFLQQDQHMLDVVGDTLRLIDPAQPAHRQQRL